MTSTRGRFLVLGVNPFEGVRCTGFVDEDYLWDLFLGQLTDDGKFDGKEFWVSCGCFCSWGGEGGKEETPGHLQYGLFFAGRHEFQTVLFLLFCFPQVR
jgi:hypothetical protein